MKIEETFNVLESPEDVWRFIRDPEKVGPCIPGLSDIEVIAQDHYKAKLKITVGPIQAAFNFDVRITEETPPTQILSVIHGEEGSRASLISAHNILRLSALENGTEVYYSSEVSITGRLGKFGLGIMKKKANALGKQFADNFCGSISGEISDKGILTSGEKEKTWYKTLIFSVVFIIAKLRTWIRSLFVKEKK